MTKNNILNVSNTENYILAGNGTGLTSITPGSSSGNILYSNGLSSLPSFNLPPSGLTLISSQTASSSSHIIFSGLTASYFTYLLVVGSSKLSALPASLYMYVSNDNGSTFNTTDNYVGLNFFNLGSTTIHNYTSTAYIPITTSTTTSSTINAYVYLYSIGTSSNFMIEGQSGFFNITVGADSRGYANIGGQSDVTGVNAIKLQASTGVIASGNFNLYGVVYG